MGAYVSVWCALDDMTVEKGPLYIEPWNSEVDDTPAPAHSGRHVLCSRPRVRSPTDAACHSALAPPQIGMCSRWRRNHHVIAPMASQRSEHDGPMAARIHDPIQVVRARLGLDGKHGRQLLRPYSPQPPAYPRSAHAPARGACRRDPTHSLNKRSSHNTHVV